MFKSVSPIATFSLKKVKWQERGRVGGEVGSGAPGPAGICRMEG